MTRRIKLSQDLVPLSELKGRPGDVIRQVETTGRPVVVTRHGRGVAVLLSLEDWERYEEAREIAELRAAVAVAEQEAREGRTRTLDEVADRWEARWRGHGDR